MHRFGRLGDVNGVSALAFVISADRLGNVVTVEVARCGVGALPIMELALTSGGPRMYNREGTHDFLISMEKEIETVRSK